MLRTVLCSEEYSASTVRRCRAVPGTEGPLGGAGPQAGARLPGPTYSGEQQGHLLQAGGAGARQEELEGPAVTPLPVLRGRAGAPRWLPSLPGPPVVT